MEGFFHSNRPGERLDLERGRILSMWKGVAGLLGWSWCAIPVSPSLSGTAVSKFNLSNIRVGIRMAIRMGIGLGVRICVRDRNRMEDWRDLGRRNPTCSCIICLLLQSSPLIVVVDVDRSFSCQREPWPTKTTAYMVRY